MFKDCDQTIERNRTEILSELGWERDGDLRMKKMVSKASGNLDLFLIHLVV